MMNHLVTVCVCVIQLWALKFVMNRSNQIIKTKNIKSFEVFIPI